MAWHILVVEDAAPIRTRLCQVLEEAGYCVAAARDGDEALKLVQRRRFDVFLVDINMPVMGGVEFITRVRELPDHRTTPIFVLTAELRPRLVEQCRALGVTAWMVKPVRPHVLLRGLDRVLAA